MVKAFACDSSGREFNSRPSRCQITTLGNLLDPVVDRVERTDRLGCFVDRLDRLHRLVDDFTTRLDLDDFLST